MTAIHSHLALLIASSCLASACASHPAPTPPSHPPFVPPAAAPAPPGSVVARIRATALALAPHVETSWAREFLAAAESLPPIAPRRLFHDTAKTRFYDEPSAARLDDATRRALIPLVADEALYYEDRYGTPLAYVRPLELLGNLHGGRQSDQFGAPALPSLGELRVLDFGFGQIGQLRMLASLGADVTGVDPHPLLGPLYGAPGDQGEIAATISGRARRGRLRIVNGRFPATPEVIAAVGDGYDLVIAKNTLKNGYLHPAEPVEERKRIRLGVSDEAFVAALFTAVKPGARVMIYNLCPAPAPPGKPYIPWADGRSPFTRAQWQAAGFRVLAFDVDDTAAARTLARRLGWDREDPPMDIDHDLFATYTLVERPM